MRTQSIQSNYQQNFTSKKSIKSRVIKYYTRKFMDEFKRQGQLSDFASTHAITEALLKTERIFGVFKRITLKIAS
jgi:hypothetical protein